MTSPEEECKTTATPAEANTTSNEAPEEAVPPEAGKPVPKMTSTKDEGDDGVAAAKEDIAPSAPSSGTTTENNNVGSMNNNDNDAAKSPPKKAVAVGTTAATPNMVATPNSSMSQVAAAGNNNNNNNIASNGMVESDAAWDARIQDLLAFKRLFGHANPRWGGSNGGVIHHHHHPAQHGPVDELAVWLEWQRSFYKQGIRLSTHRIQMLRDIGCSGFDNTSISSPHHHPVVSRPAAEEAVLIAWFSQFLELRYFKARMGHSNPRGDHHATSIVEKHLADWLNGQRDMYHNGTHAFPAQVDMLREAGCTGFDEVVNDGTIDNNNPENNTSSVVATTTVGSTAPVAASDEMEVSEEYSGADVASNPDVKVPVENKSAGDDAEEESNNKDDNHNGLTLAWRSKLQELDQLMSPDQETSGVEQLNDNDVVCWEAGHTGYDIIYGMLPGNVQFRDLVSQEEKKYNLNNKKNVMQIAGQVVKLIRSMSPPGRFLKKNDDDGLWYDIGNVDAIKQALRALREDTQASPFGIGDTTNDMTDEFPDEASAAMEGGATAPHEETFPDESDVVMATNDDDDQDEEGTEDTHPTAATTITASGLATEEEEEEEEEIEEEEEEEAEAEEQESENSKQGVVKMGRRERTSLAIWHSKFEQLLAFQEERGHVNPRESKKSTSSIENKLARWVREQRMKFRNGKLTKDLAKKLRDLGCRDFDEGNYAVRVTPTPNTRPKSRPVTWDGQFQKLCNYKDREGHANPTQTRTATEADLRLANWLSAQRKSFYGGTLSQEKSLKLRDLGSAGFELECETEAAKNKPRCMPWESRYLELQVYTSRHGHCSPREALKDVPIENKLGRWLREQRTKLRSGNLSVEQAQQLTDLGAEGFETEQDQVESQMPHSDEVEEQSFDGGYNSDDSQAQQQVETESVVSSQRPSLSVGNKDNWESRYQDLVAFNALNGHPNPKRSRGSSDADYKLGAWLSSQRVKLKSGKLEAYRAQKLRDLGCFGFQDDDSQSGDREARSDVGYGQPHVGHPYASNNESFEEDDYGAHAEPKRRKTWGEHFSELRRYVETYGHAAPSQARGSQPELVRWLTDQRFKFRRGSLGPEKAQKLRAVGCKGFEDETEEESPYISEPNRNDVVLGRGGGTNSWPGNVQYRSLVQRRKQEYLSKAKHEKLEIAKEIVRQIRSMNPSGRFLKEEPNGWVDVGEDHSIKKTSQALREMKAVVQEAPLPDEHLLEQQASSSSSVVGSINSEQESGEGVGYRSDASYASNHDNQMRRESVSSSTQRRRGSSSTVVQRRESFSSRRNMRTWDDHYQDLIAYKARNGHANPGCSRGPDYRLGHWLADQRYKFRKGDLNQEKSKKLSRMGCRGFETFDGGAASEAESSVDEEQGRMDYYDSDSSEDSTARVTPSRQQQQQQQQQQRLTRKRRFGVFNNPATNTTRSGRCVNKKKNKSGDDDYVFY